MYIRQGEKILYGCNQDWYGIEWRRRAGCGPVAATNILLYLRKKYDAARIPYSGDSIDDALAAMNDMFTYVRPRLRGLNTVKMFVDGMYKFGQKYGLSFWHQYLLVPPQAEKRPDLDTVVRFIEDGVKNDVPVAFLNLHAGEVEAQLAGWHWVTVVGIAKGETPPDVRLRYFDQSEDLEVDLGKWLRTTKRGGGFAYFCKPSPRPDFCPADAPKDAG